MPVADRLRQRDQDRRRINITAPAASSPSTRKPLGVTSTKPRATIVSPVRREAVRIREIGAGRLMGRLRGHRGLHGQVLQLRPLERQGREVVEGTRTVGVVLGRDAFQMNIGVVSDGRELVSLRRGGQGRAQCV